MVCFSRCSADESLLGFESCFDYVTMWPYYNVSFAQHDMSSQSLCQVCFPLSNTGIVYTVLSLSIKEVKKYLSVYFSDSSIPQKLVNKFK